MSLLGSNSAVRLVMLGPPGAGKGTQAERFARAHGIPRISTGDILRETVLAGSEMGRAAREVMDAGGLVGDDIMTGIVTERLSRPDVGAGFVLEGFPRTVPQAMALDGLIDRTAPLVVVDIEVPEDVLVKRLQIRKICGTCGWTAPPGTTVCAKCGGSLITRTDDHEVVVRQRHALYGRTTQPNVDYYESRNTFRSVDGDQTEGSVAADLSAAVASVLGGTR